MNDVFARPRVVNDIEECYFYHSIELPGYGLMKGDWDLRHSWQDYLGNEDLAGKRVLEMGTASGFLCFQMEKQGAEVVAYDLSENDEWDVVPYGGQAQPDIVANRKTMIKMINNAWWFTHHLVGSKAHLVYGSVYDVPYEIGLVDVTTFGSILLHLRDPFLALERAARLTRETIIVTDAVPVLQRSRLFPIWRALEKIDPRLGTYLIPEINFLPDPDKGEPWDTWWNITSNLVSRFLKILGFQDQQLLFHDQIHHYGQNRQQTRKRRLYTIVAKRLTLQQ